MVVMRFLLELVVVVRLAGVHRFASLAVLSRHGLFVYYLAVPKFKIFTKSVVGILQELKPETPCSMQPLSHSSHIQPPFLPKQIHHQVCLWFSS